MLKGFLNKKVNVIPPLFYQNQFIIGFEEKAELLYQQSSIYRYFSNKDVGKVIQNLNPNIVRRHGSISIQKDFNF